MRIKAVLILVLLIFSLLPAYALFEYLKKWWRPRESTGRFAGWLVSSFALVFLYTFLVAFIIRVLFPRA